MELHNKPTEGSAIAEETIAQDPAYQHVPNRRHGYRNSRIIRHQRHCHSKGKKR